MSRFDALFDAELRRREAAGLRRSLVPTAPLAPGQVQRQGQRLLNFSSNDYLGLARHPLLAQRAAEYATAYGTGAGASRLVTGTQPVHAALEARVAAWKGRPAAMLLASGWQANVAVLGSLLRFFGPGTLLFTDELNHSSLVHGARVAGIKPLRYRHNDMAQLGAMLHEARALPHQRVIATESVFSMDGDRADIAALAALAEEHNAFLYVDEAHASGVLGPNGAGLCTAQSRVDLVMGTFSKAMGSFGAYVAGSQALIDFLINACAGFIYTTAPPPPILGAIDAALDLMPHWMPRGPGWHPVRSGCGARSRRSGLIRLHQQRRSFRPLLATRRRRWICPRLYVHAVFSPWPSVRPRFPPAPAVCASRCPPRMVMPTSMS
jgi:8-amino-7-oxononanoate synthase